MSDEHAHHKPDAVVGIGASAGGLDALKRFLAAIPSEGHKLAYIVVQHLDPKHESMMVELLQRATPLRVVQAEDAAEIRSGTVYVIPPGRILRVHGERIRLSDKGDQIGGRLAVDALFRSLAGEYADSSIGVVLSGSGSDGSAGLRAIAAVGGLCAAQDPDTAEHDGMPRSAYETDVLHICLPIEELPAAVAKSVFHPSPIDHADAGQNNIEELLALIQKERGTDFRHYKPNTIVRRVGRRMGILGIQRIKDYVSRLKNDDQEFDHLCRDLLISVTAFFRDADSFEYLKREVLPQLIDQHPEQQEVRAWVAGCATGEEAYTVAIQLLERVRLSKSGMQVQVFASDIDSYAIDHARAGVYMQADVEVLSEELIERYFEDRNDGTYRVGKQLRESVIFADQDLLSDPPFSRVDLVSCRNLLIYLKPRVQEQIFSIFHFALRPGGYLLLGASESGGRSTDKFRSVSRTHRILQRLGSEKGSLPKLPLIQPRLDSSRNFEHLRQSRTRNMPLGQMVDRWINERFAPASVVINQSFEILYYSSTAHKYLKIPEGEPTNNLIHLMESEPSMRIRAMVGRVIRSEEGIAPRPIMLHRSTASVDTPLEAQVGVMPFMTSEDGDSLFIVTFREISHHTDKQAPEEIEESTMIAQLEQELKSTREDLQTTIEEMESTNEELKASNEEAMSVNEELQSTNEELETSKEELQSLNEELSTVNAQLKDKLGEVEAVNNDINNLLVSTDLGVLFLDTDLTIKRYTPGIEELYRIAPGDINRPVGDITRNFVYEDLEQDARQVMDRLERIERRVDNRDGRIFLQRILPYRTQDNRIDGVVITYSDITEMQQTISSLHRSRDQQSALAELGNVVLDEHDLQGIFDTAVRLVREALDADLAKILQMQGEDGPLKLISGVGWDAGIVGSAQVDAKGQSQAGYTLLREAPVVVPNLAEETRFHGPELLTSHGVKSGISTVIRSGGAIWGVIGIHSRDEDRFDDQDIDFVTSVASLLGQAIEENQNKQRILSGKARLDFALHAAEIGTWEYRPLEDMVEWSDHMYRLLGVSRASKGSIEKFWERVHPDDREELDRKLKVCFSDRSDYKADFRIRMPSGEIKWLHGAGSIVDNEHSESVMYGVNFDITERKLAEQQLLQIRENLEHEVEERGVLAEQRLKEIRRMTHDMIIAESVERRRLASELHDNLSQLLNLALMRLGTLRKDAPNTSQIGDIIGIIQQASDTTRSVMAQLTPQVLDELGLGPAIDWLAEQTQKIYEIKVDVKHHTKPIDIAPEHELVAFRAVRELLINVAKHAEVGAAEVTLDRGDMGFRIEVHDDGAGFDVDRVFHRSDRRYGLLGMRERITHIGGELDISSAPGNGCRVVIELPDPTPQEEVHDANA